MDQLFHLKESMHHFRGIAKFWPYFFISNYGVLFGNSIYDEGSTLLKPWLWDWKIKFKVGVIYKQMVTVLETALICYLC